LGIQNGLGRLKSKSIDFGFVFRVHWLGFKLIFWILNLLFPS